MLTLSIISLSSSDVLVLMSVTILVLLGLTLYSFFFRRDSALREKRLHSREKASRLREAGFQSREDDSLLREAGFQSREDDSHLREAGLQSQAEDSRLREEGFHSREKASHLREAGLQSQAKDSRLREAGFQSREDDSLLREAGLQSRAEDSRLREVDFQSREDDSLLREKGLRADIGVLQAAIMPALPPALSTLEISAAYLPARGDVGGGDFFDAFELNNGQVVIIIGDVSGHGEKVVQKTALVHYGIRAWLKEGIIPRLALRRASLAFKEDLGEAYATVLVCHYDPSSSTFTWASAGHPLPLILGMPFSPIVASGAPPIGLGVRSGQRQTSIVLPDSAVVCLCTDGLKEARLEHGELLGTPLVKTILQEQLQKNFSAEEFLKAVSVHADTTQDDIAAVLIRVQNGQLSDSYVEELEIFTEDDLAIVYNFLEDGGMTEESTRRCLQELKEKQKQHRAILLRFSPYSQTYKLTASDSVETDSASDKTS